MSSESIDELIAAVRREADAAEFPIDAPVYHRAGRDPKDPILFAGSLAAPLCIVGRDLGKDEVAAGQPLIGAAGRLVRLGVLKAWGDPKGAETQPTEGPPLQEALDYAVLTNTVPYKPPGNKAYAESVRRRFRPFLERLLTRALARPAPHHPGLRGVRVVRALYRPGGVHRTRARPSADSSRRSTAGSHRIHRPGPHSRRSPSSPCLIPHHSTGAGTTSSRPCWPTV